MVLTAGAISDRGILIQKAVLYLGRETILIVVVMMVWGLSYKVLSRSQIQVVINYI